MEKDATYWIEKLDLKPHPEGGFYAEMFRSAMRVQAEWGERSALTSIFYLLEGADYSGFHKIKSPELWYFHAGAELHIHEIDVEGSLVTHALNSENPFVAIKPESWFASEVAGQNGYVLASCAVGPGFDFTDFEMAKANALVNLSPKNTDLIHRLSR